jgi:N-acetylglutamate synthase-like GNAT family acetyltransferase
MISIKVPKTREEFKAYYELRYRVLRAPWGQPKDTEKDDYEPISQHFMAVDEETGKIVGVVKVFEKSNGIGWFSHLAVDPGFQRRGIGLKLILAVEAVAKENGYTILGCMSRLNTTAYFEKRGFSIAGFPSNYFGTTQVVWMEKELK